MYARVLLVANSLSVLCVVHPTCMDCLLSLLQSKVFVEFILQQVFCGEQPHPELDLWLVQ